MPVGGVRAKSACCSFEKSLRSARLPRHRLVHGGRAGVPFMDPEQTKPPGIASTSTPKLGERRIASGSS